MFSDLYFTLKDKIKFVLKNGDNDEMDMLEIDHIISEIEAEEEQIIEDVVGHMGTENERVA